MEIPSGKVLAKPLVASLGRLIVILNAKRRQSGIRVSIEPRDFHIQEVDRVRSRENNIM